MLLDMFAIVEQLRVDHPHHFHTLTQVPATFHKVHYDRCEVCVCVCVCVLVLMCMSITLL